MLVPITPEGFDIANAFLRYGSVEETANQLQIPRHEVVRVINTSEVKRYLDNIYLDKGYRNRDAIATVLDEMINSKLEEARESGMYTSKDLLELIKLAHQMRMDEIKLNANEVPSVAVQVNNQFGDSNYGKLMEKLVNG